MKPWLNIHCMSLTNDFPKIKLSNRQKLNSWSDASTLYFMKNDKKSILKNQKFNLNLIFILKIYQ